jgi:hypothetical protein
MSKAKDKILKAKHDAEQRIRDAKRKRDDAIHKAQADAKSRVEKIGDKIKTAIKNARVSKADFPYIQLLPLKPAMIVGLKRKHISHNGKLHQIAPLFLQHVVVPSYSKSNTANLLNGANNVYKHSFNVDDITTGDSAEGGSSSSGQSAEYEKDAKATVSMIQKIVKWFQERKAKKKAKDDALANGKTEEEANVTGDLNAPSVTADEDAILNEARKTADGLIDSASKDVDNDDILGTGFSVTEIVLGVLGITVLIFVLKKIFGK